METTEHMPVALSTLPSGTKCTLFRFARLEDETVRRLRQLGVTEGMPLYVLEKTINGPVVIAVSDTHVAISSPAADEMLVLTNP